MNKTAIVRAVVCGVLAALAVTFAAPVFAQEIKFSGEVKTGVFWKETQANGDDDWLTSVALHSKDDAGGEGDQGRYRLNIDYDNGKGFGMRARIQWQNWMENMPQWSYAFGYGNFFDDNLTVAIGKLGGGGPWGTGGPEMWKELETTQGGGMRVEYKPGWVPEEYGKFNVGFVLNWFDAPFEAGSTKPVTLADLLGETVFGIAWTHDWFLFRFAYRLDSEYDRAVRGTEDIGVEGTKLLYRIEERVLSNFLPGLQIWALGYFEGVGADPEFAWYRNWLFAQYAPEQFTAQIRLGLDYIESRQDFYIKPSFYWNFFDGLLSAGLLVGYCQDFGEGKIRKDSPYRYFEIQPKVQVNFTSSYIAFEYNFTQEYTSLTTAQQLRNLEPITQTHWINLRFCIYY